MKIFVTGATGFIGKNFLKIATESNNQIFAVTRKKNRSQNNSVKWLKGKISDDWGKYLKKSDVLVHLAAEGVINKKTSLTKCLNFNVHETLKLLLSAYRSGCHKWIIIGSSSEYGETLSNKKLISKNDKPQPLDNYSISKSILCESSISISKYLGVKLIYFRLFPVYGNGENKNRLIPLIKSSAKKNRNFYIKNPYANIDYSEVKDVCRKILGACEFQSNKNLFPQVWHLASGNHTTIKNFATKKWKLMGAKGKITFSKNNKEKVLHHISDKKSIWINK
jgi:nucleoside-diphosphate-sugar epimerase